MDKIKVENEIPIAVGFKVQDYPTPPLEGGWGEDTKKKMV